mmetsp:Transcript_27590/g.65469  ORF Transcript_27590/g.65469 Transcript_27590/m.65469 type:complete len:1092 (-) Transcript_27590:365-3640(-)
MHPSSWWITLHPVGACCVGLCVCVCVCVQGGPGTADTVLSAARAGTPILLVRGSGKAADLIADSVLLQLPPGHLMYLPPETRSPIQKTLFEFLEELRSSVTLRVDLHTTHHQSKDDASRKIFTDKVKIAIARLIDQIAPDAADRIKQAAEALRGGQSLEYTSKDLVKVERIEQADEKDLKAKLVRLHITISVFSDVASTLVRQFGVEKDSKQWQFLDELGTVKAAKAFEKGRPGSLRISVQQLNADAKPEPQHVVMLHRLNKRISQLGRESSGPLAELARKYWGREKGPASDAELQAIRSSIEASLYELCWVFELPGHKQAQSQQGPSDMSEGLLRCLLNGYGWEDSTANLEGEDLSKHQERIFTNKLLAAVEWNNAQVLAHLVRNTWMDKLTLAFTRAMDAALHRALVLLRPDLVDFLINNGANVDNYACDRKLLDAFRDCKFEISPNSARESDENSTLESCWNVFKEASGEACKQSVLSKQHEKQADKDAQRELQNALLQSMACLQHWPDLIARIPTSRGGRKEEFTHLNHVRQLLLAKKQTVTGVVDARRFAACLVGWPSDEEDKQTVKQIMDLSVQLLVCYEEWVKSLVGKGFQYRMNLISPELDLMIWSGIVNNRSLAFVWWKEYQYPVRSALTMCRLYHQLQKNPTVPPSDRKVMEASATFFEAVALGVQKECRTASYRLSLAVVEAPLSLWPNMTIVDVAIVAECESFLTQACREAIEQRFAGDLLAYGQRSAFFGWHGLKYNVIGNLFFLGLGAPWWLRFRRWPAAEYLRYPTQRMQLEKSSKTANSTDADGPQTNNSARLLEDGDDEEADMRPSTSTELEWSQWILGTDDSAGLYAGFKLFWQAPVTLFLADSLTTVCMVVLFTWFTFAVSDDSERTPFSRSNATSPEMDPTDDSTSGVFFFEYVVAGWFACRFFSEVVQVMCASDWKSHFNDFWNSVDIISVLSFFAGFGMRFYCWGNARCLEDGGSIEVLWTDSVPIGRLFALYYSIALALLWARLLRLFSVSKTLGPLVIVIIRMGSARPLYRASSPPSRLLALPLVHAPLDEAGSFDPRLTCVCADGTGKTCFRSRSSGWCCSWPSAS